MGKVLQVGDETFISPYKYAPVIAPSKEHTTAVIGSLCGKDRLQVIANYACKCQMLEGEFWECGVFNGGSAALIAQCAHPDTTVRLFDSFEGISEPTQEDKNVTGWEAPMEKGEWKGVVGNVVAMMPRSCTIHKGWIPETFNGLENCKIAFAHVDVDLYQPIKDCLLFILPRLVSGGVVIVDDFGYPRNPGVEKAVREVLPPDFHGHNEADWQLILYRVEP